MIQEIEENDEQRQIVAYLPEGSDIEVEQKMRCCLTTCQERSGLDKGQTVYFEVCNQVGGRSEEKRKKQQKGNKPKNRSKARTYFSRNRRISQRKCQRRALMSKMHRCVLERKLEGEL